MISAPRHSWERQGEHLHRCRRCGLERRAAWTSSGPWEDQGAWSTTFTAADGTATTGRTPPCRADAAVPSAPVASVIGLVSTDARCPEPRIPAPALRPVREFLPLLAGPPDAAAEAYRAWLSRERVPAGGCAACRHWESGTDRCRHPACRGLPADHARSGDGWPLVDSPAGVTMAIRPARSLAPEAYRHGGACGPLARLFEVNDGR